MMLYINTYIYIYNIYIYIDCTTLLANVTVYTSCILLGVREVFSATLADVIKGVYGLVDISSRLNQLFQFSFGQMPPRTCG